MTTTQKIINRMQAEANATRKMLAIVPNDKMDWRPHPKSMTIRQLATHVAELPGWVTIAMNTDELDFSKDANDAPEINSREELLDYYEKQLALGTAALQNAKDEDLQPNWTLRNGAQIFSVQPKEEVINMSINQTIHHRAQLGVFLRLLDIPIPGAYGPSADEKSLR